MTAISSIRNLGPAFEAKLIATGIPTTDALPALGAGADYHTLLNAGLRPHFIGYYVLHLAIQDRP